MSTKTAIVLSGGGSKGDFELGALSYLYSTGVRPDIVCGTSVGAINAAKIAEGEDPTDPSRGLAGLVTVWESMRTNSDMYVNASWLSKIAPEVAAVITSTSPLSSLDPWKSWWPDIFINFSWLLSTGQDIFAAMKVILAEAVSLYDCSPLRSLIDRSLDPAKIAAWGQNGHQLRLAMVSLESGALRYVTETGAVLERDGSTPVLGALVPSMNVCVAERQALSDAEGQLNDLRDVYHEATLADRPHLLGAISKQTAVVATLRRALSACMTNPLTRGSLPPLIVDVRDGVKASAALPVAFSPWPCGSETYVDGGVREVLPSQPAVTAGATLIYAISADPLHNGGAAPPWLLLDIANRSVEILQSEAEFIETHAAQNLSGVNYFLVQPDFSVHDAIVVDPGLIQISRDYGYMRCADVVNKVDPLSRRFALPTIIATQRVAIWKEEIAEAGQLDPTTPGSVPTFFPQPAYVLDIQAKKQQLRTLLDERAAAGDAMPPGLYGWTTIPERHPWPNVKAFQANTGHLWTAGPSGGSDWALGMMAGTSPSISSSGEVAFQANTGRLWTVGPDGGGDLGLGMIMGTSPSIS